MKRKNLLKLKSLIMAGVMMSFISACSKDNSDSESIKKEVKSNYCIVVMENNKSLEFAKKKLKKKLPVLIVTIGILLFGVYYSFITII